MRIFSHIGVILFLCGGALPPAFAQQGDSVGPPLSDIEQLRMYAESKTVAVRQVSLEGVVTWVAAGEGAFVLQEGTNATRFELQSPGVPARCGQRVRLEGSVALGNSRALLRQSLQIEDDGLHGLRERSGRQRFKAGWHAFTLEYFQGLRDMGLEIYFQPIGSARQRITPEMLFHSEDGTNYLPGVCVDYYEGSWVQLPDFRRLTPLRQALATNLAIIEPNAGTNFALRFSGHLRLPADGEYRFYLASDDGCRFSFKQRPWSLTVLGDGELPPAQMLLPGQHLDALAAWRWSEVAGDVHFAGASEGRGAFDLVSDAGRMRVELGAVEDWWPELLLGAQVRARGVVAGLGKPGEALLAGELHVSSAGEVLIERLPAQAWQRFPSNTVAGLRSTARTNELVKLSGWLKTTGERGLGVSEYGAGGSTKHHEDWPPRQPEAGGRWHPEEYQSLCHEQQYEQIALNPAVWGSFVWNGFDFGSDDRAEGDSGGINDKGLVSYDRRTRKDAFYFYKANWNPEPMVHLNSRRFVARDASRTTVRAYSNCDSVELLVNGKSAGVVVPDKFKVVNWPLVHLCEGENLIQLVGRLGEVLVRDECHWKLQRRVEQANQTRGVTHGEIN